MNNRCDILGAAWHTLTLAILPSCSAWWATWPNTTRTRGLCRTNDLSMVGYMARPAFWAVLGPARHENDM